MSESKSNISLENELAPDGKWEGLVDNKFEWGGLSDLVEKDSEELEGIVSQSENLEGNISSADPKVQEGISEIGKEEAEEIKEWKKASEEIVNGQEVEVTNEDWRRAAEERFGIKDFNLEKFKRQKFNQELLRKAFADGHDWEYIGGNIDEYLSEYSYEPAVKAFEAMAELEEKLPGCVKELHEKFGLMNFQRYPKEILLNQLQETDPQKETGLLIFAESDWNGAFDNQAGIWSKAYEHLKDTLNFRIIECGSGTSLARQLIKTKQDFEKGVSLGVLSSHSDQEGFLLGEDHDDKINGDNLKENVANLKEIFTEDAQFLANACSSGVLGGWLSDFSKGARIRAVGPDRPAGIIDISFLGKEVVPEYQDSDAYAGYQNGFLLSKQKNLNYRNGFWLSKQGKGKK